MYHTHTYYVIEVMKFILQGIFWQNGNFISYYILHNFLKNATEIKKNTKSLDLFKEKTGLRLRTDYITHRAK